MTEPLRIVVVAPDLIVSDPTDDHALDQAARSRSLRIGLLENGFNLVATLPVDVFLPDRLSQLQPDMIIVDAESAARDTLEHVVMATREAPRPIVLFTNDDDTRHVKDAVAAGVTAYVVAGLEPERIRPILDVAMARFEHEQALRQELQAARSELADRKTDPASPRSSAWCAPHRGPLSWPEPLGGYQLIAESHEASRTIAPWAASVITSRTSAAARRAHAPSRARRPLTCSGCSSMAR
jgi:response regulator NasT